MGHTIETRVEDGIAVLTLNRPPGNRMARDLLLDLAAALEAAEDDPAVRAVVLIGAGRGFSSGTELTEIDTGTPALLGEVLDRVERMTKPVLAAMHGRVRGAGVDLALAAHYRLAAEDARFALPDVTLGLSPSGGATQRLPRLVGADAALGLLLTGRTIGADEAAGMGLLDGVVEGDLESAALSFAEELAGQTPRPTGARRRGMKDPQAYFDAVRAHRERSQSLVLDAPRRIVDCVEAALLLPFENGLAYERAAFDELAAGEDSIALRHVALAERRTLGFPEAARAKARPVRACGVVGAGDTGSAIAAALLLAGRSVTVLERESAAVTTAKKRIADHVNRATRGRGLQEITRGLIVSADPEVMAGCDFVIEAVPDDLSAKTEAFGLLDAVMAPGAILATATAELDIDLLAAGTGRPGEVLGLHFFAPAHMMRLVEVVVGEVTEARTVMTAMSLVRALGKTPIRSAVSDGFVADRVMGAFRRAADALLEDGASVQDIDAALRAFGFPLGPFQIEDLVGLDIGWDRRRRTARTRDPDERYIAIADALCAAGRLGRRTGRGYYRYDSVSGAGVPDPEVARIVAEERRRKGLRARTFTPEEIQERCVLAMVAAGAALVEEGTVTRASDIDVAMVHGFAFPRWKGGPMHWADRRGLLRVKSALDGLSAADPGLWSCPPILARLIESGRPLGAVAA